MTQEKPQPNIQEKKHDLSRAVLGRIEKEHLEPVPRWRIQCSEYAIWGLWGTSVLIGAVSVSVMFFVISHTGYAFYEATHESAFDFFIEMLPQIWIAVFLVMLVLTYINFRKTKKGYKYPLWALVVSSLLLSLLGGVILHNLGLGYYIDKELNENMPMFRSLSHEESKMWQKPEKGRLLGAYDTDGVFVAVDGTNWLIDQTELMEEDIVLLKSGVKVRVWGMVATDTDAYFYSCAVLPWMFEKPMPMKELRKERGYFMDRLEYQAQKLRNKGEEDFETLGLIDEDVPALDFDSKKEKVVRCPHIPLIRKMIPI